MTNSILAGDFELTELSETEILSHGMEILTNATYNAIPVWGAYAFGMSCTLLPKVHSEAESMEVFTGYSPEHKCFVSVFRVFLVGESNKTPNVVYWSIDCEGRARLEARSLSFSSSEAVDATVSFLKEQEGFIDARASVRAN
ncbi:hypothetical protein VCHA53O466_140175 [Vibrio chagasii]|nr:hypothetical protein VCHA53O466_140175 [Vibrio chagasii]